MKNCRPTVSIVLGFILTLVLLSALSFQAQAAPDTVCRWTGPESIVPRNWSDVSY